MRAFRAPWAILLAAALPAAAGALLLAMRSTDGSTPDAPVNEPPDAPPIVAAREVCSFANSDAAAAQIEGADGGQSVVVDGRSYWLFGDTLFAGVSGKQIEANTIASSTSRDANGCPDLDYHARSGVGVPFLEKDGSLTVWPSGAIANEDGTFDVFTVYVYGSGPWAYWIGEIGLARVDPSNMSVQTRARRLFDAESGFRSQIIAAQPIDEDAEGRLRVVLQASNGEKLLARVPRDGSGDATAYEYWDGASWGNDPSRAAPLWSVEKSADPIAALTLFEGSAHITWSDALGAYVALTNAGHAAIGARTAAQLEGPWSEIEPWIDCSAIAQERVPVCYAPSLHPQLSTDGSLFVTLTRFGEYDIVAYELTLGQPVHEYRDGDTVAYGFSPPGDGWEDLGVAFHAARAQAEGLSAIYRWERDGAVAYAANAPASDFSRGEAAFYAPLAPADVGSPLEHRPVYAWSDGVTHLLSTMSSGLEIYGLERGAIAFYTPRR